VDGIFYAHENAWACQDTLRRAIVHRGAPEVLYCDNGAPFKNAWLARTCAVLGVRLVQTSWSGSVLEEAAGALGESGLAKFDKGALLDLADPFPAQMALDADLVERAGLAPIETEAKPQHQPFSVVEAPEEGVELIGQGGVDHGLEWRDGAGVDQTVGQFEAVTLIDGLRQ
jgi:hypothetical protein